MDAPRLPVIVNRSGGTASRAGDSLEDDLAAAFSATGSHAEILLVEGSEISETLEFQSGARRIVMGGGDGTIASGAQFAAAHGMELGVLPLGTRNHFARQLAIPLDLGEAAGLAATGGTEAVDLGDCAGDVFINNASVGAYVDLVRDRQASSLPKLPASIVAAFRILLHLRPRRYTLTIDGERREVVTPMLFIGNNRYEIAEGHPGERDSLADGQLSIFALAPLSLLALLGLALRTLFGRPDMRRDFAIDCVAQELVIEGTGHIEIALDGERKSFDLPLKLAVRLRALRVVVPPQSND